VRGLKQGKEWLPEAEALSHPARVRGLKLYGEGEIFTWQNVAPRAGAWIETAIIFGNWQELIVAPRAGAWIETTSIQGMEHWEMVAPRAGAWIETRPHN